LQDWEVEDFVLLATVDGHIHARDRNTGTEIWHLDAGRPMVETIYHQSNDSADEDGQEMPFIWIVEPSENGRLYVLEPGPQPRLQNLDLTVRQLVELSAYTREDPPVVYTAQKKNVMYQLDARTGTVLKEFGLGGSTDVNAESCAPQVTGFPDSKVRECKGHFNLGQTEYTIRIQNLATGNDICTIKYFEWTPNNRDHDLHGQYLTTMDNRYIYSRFDGEIYALDHSSRRQIDDEKRVYRKKLPSPVVRVYDVARPFENDDDDPSLVLLPQPIGPATLDDASQNVWLNCTESGSWYAMSEDRYPAVTDGATKALCYYPQWSRHMETWGGAYVLPDKKALVGVHSLNYSNTGRGDVPTISAPLQDLDILIDEPSTPEVPQDELRNSIEEKKKTAWWPWLITVLAIIFGLGSYGFAKPESLDMFKKQATIAEKPFLAAPSIETEPVNMTEAPIVDPDERRVRFAIPEEDPELEPLSRATTIESSPTIEVDGVTMEDQNQEISENRTGVAGENTDAQDTPKPKKKAHRGQRGGKKKRKIPKDEDEVGRIVEAAKQLDPDHPMQPDEITVNGSNVQDISNIKK
jgi:serine/threonine-protein kinase/endoribonuclease IRE1